MGAVKGYQMITYEVPHSQIVALQNKFSGLSDALINKKIIETIALQIKENIIARTQTGKDIDGKKFKAYTKKYSDKKGKVTVNLTDTGLMMNAITQKAMSNDTAKIFFMDKHSAKIAKIHNDGEGKMPQREFFGVGKFDQADALRIYKDLANKEMRKRGL